MNLGIGIIRAPRPESTVQKTIDSLRASFPEGTQPICVFQEPGSGQAPLRCAYIERPEILGLGDSAFESSPEGTFGNFQNWIQTARDLLWRHQTRDTLMICEDDALFAPGILQLLERDLWPAKNCGVVSLYCPNMSQYGRTRGLNQAHVVRTGFAPTTRNNLVGSLALVFPRHVLEKVAYHKSIDQWGGSHAQVRSKGAKPWERKAVDTWIGRTLVELKTTIWHYSPSLVLHYSPFDSKSNSSLGHDAPRGTHSVRQGYEWVGSQEQDLCSLYPKPKERHEFPADLPANQI